MAKVGREEREVEWPSNDGGFASFEVVLQWRDCIMMHWNLVKALSLL